MNVDPGARLTPSRPAGTPKAIMHHHGGMVLASKQASLLHADCKPSDVILQITTCGWMMWCVFAVPIVYRIN